MTRWLGAAFALLGLALALAPSCQPKPLTQIMVIIDTDMTVPSELDGFRVEVTDDSGRLVHSQSFDLAQQVALPADFGVLPRDDDASRRITVDVTALRGIDELFSTRAITTFVEGEKIYLQLFLAERCIDVECSPSETCRREGCVPEDAPALIGTKTKSAPRSLGSAGNDRPEDIVLGKDGACVGGLYGPGFSIEGAGFPEPGSQGYAAFVACFDSGGGLRWARGLPATELSSLDRLHLAANGSIDAVGYFDGTLTETSSGQTVASTGSQSSYLARYSASGSLQKLAVVARGSSNVQSFGLAALSGGRRAIGGVHTGGVTFGDAIEVPAGGLASLGNDDGFVALLDDSGAGLWAATLGGPNADRVVAVAASGDAIYAAGIFAEQAQLGPDALSGALENGFLARLTEQGDVTWGRAQAGDGSEIVRDAAVLPDGGIAVVGGTASNPLLAGPQTLTGLAGDTSDPFIVVYEASGDVRWARRLTGVGAGEAWSVTGAEYQGEPVVLVSGEFAGELTLGTQTLTADGIDLFVACLSPQGEPRFALAVGGAGDEGRAEVGAGSGRALLAGEFSATVGVGTASFDSAGATDIVLLQIVP